MAEIKKVAVIGSGVMGGAIAAHVANAGIPVVLLDVAAKEGDRSAIAKGAIDRLLKTDPAPFMHNKNARLITPGNLDDDLNLLADVDWIVEAIVERLDIKHALYEKLEKARKPGSIVSSNTSTIPLDKLVEGRSAEFQRDFVITHFFNPPRYMRLLELVVGKKTSPDVAKTIEKFCDVNLGKGVVHCHDTPGFIANRIGTFWIQQAINSAMDLGLTVEEADAVSGRPMGIPKTGVFGLVDLVGLDLMPHISASLLSTLPPKDAYRDIARDVPLFKKLIESGYTGRKGKGGFYRLDRTGGAKTKQTLDLVSGEYRNEQRAQLTALDASKAGGLKGLVTSDDKGGKFAWAVLSATLSYAADLVPEIADTVHDLDEGMRLGYAWKRGPFELIDELGTGWFADKLKAEGKPIPKMLAVANGRPFYRVENGKLQQLLPSGDYADIKRPDGVLLLADIKRASKPVAKNASAQLWDIGDGVLCLEFRSKMNSMDADIMAMIQRAIGTIGDGKSGPYKALVVYNEGDNFSVGANLGLALFALNLAMYPQVEEMVSGGQQTYKAMKYAPFPTVVAPFGMALGGGCEIVLHASAVQAHAELYIGLVEVGVGLIPGWGGCKEMIVRHQQNKKRPGGPMPAVGKAFEIISTATVSRSAAQAQEYLFLRDSDGITMNRDRLLADAKARALELSKDYKPPVAPEIRLPGPTAKAAFKLAVDGFVASGKATAYDQVVSDALGDILSGGNTDITEIKTEDDITALERAAFMKLVRNDGTVARIETMLETGKPLRN
ncbi:3-hydroxyacyl-CoA dehydrogenase/enoyl-CoA hydratase family protein [Roseiterribacter gracilis]|uniref:3-hydroxyacyl-CoA dehydrogenase n=1 Tax=Roseiterribacter gracilis TaxID=2812848 RepID=A0A8S8X870_9PROT|nr:3-hydroxyacyl-CoA dehydrogenase [Rhodospirillales bacterium TMPK1]